MTTALSSIEPSVPSSPSWNDLSCTDCSGTFSYYLHADWTTWQTWEYEVADPTTYAVTELETDHAETFSAFILMIQCTTANDYDGCCFKSNSDGALCILAGNSNAQGDTYRINEADWATTIAAFSSSQADYQGESVFTGSLVDTTDATVAINYFDYADCTTTGSSVHTCKMWQPNWG